MNTYRLSGRRLGLAGLAAALLSTMPAGARSAAGQETGAASTATLSAEALLDTLRATVDSVDVLQSIEFTDPAADVEFLRLLVLEQFSLRQRVLETMADLLRGADPGSLPADSIRTVLRGHITDHLDLIESGLESLDRDYERLRRERSRSTAEELGTLESEIRSSRAWADSLIRYEAFALSISDSLQLGLEDRWESFEQRLHNIAETLTGRLHLAAADRETLEEQIDLDEGADSPESETAGLRLRLAALETRIEGITGTMNTVIEILRHRGVETAAYEEIVIQTTGEVTGEVLEWGVLTRLARDFASDTWQFLRHNAGTVFVRTLIVVFFIVLFRVTFGLLWRLAMVIRPAHGSRLVRDLVGRTLRPLSILVGLIAGLSFIGVQTTTLLAGLGVAGLVVGFALQDSLSNLFAGFAILANRPYDMDDVVEVAGVIGTVRAMGLWTTTVMRFDGRRLMVPNRSIWGSNIENWTVEERRRVDCVVRIGYGADLERALVVLEQLLRDDPRVLEDPAPHVWVSSLDESWVELKVWGWVKSEDWWPLYSELRRLVRLKLADEGIEVPARRYEQVRATQNGPPGAPEAADPAGR
ncbi:MAG: mechanosensitive ion channel family protein [Candidatus Palauibacterales bacterium]|nr:mechanosensitive ion channel family protein [Candidatus Palauibacterales bacterium]MDP2482774.1 mechanosensitive ion channel family protein [Candidatus Palauibacterales bacterium]